MKNKIKVQSASRRSPATTQAKAKRMYLHQGPDGSAPLIARRYDASYRPSAADREQLPDMMEATNAIQGSPVAIQQVGISNFRLPLRFAAKKGPAPTLEASVTGTVSLDASLKGINMSRIMRSFYDARAQLFTPDSLPRILKTYQRVISSLHARLRIQFSYPLVQTSLRSDLDGFQYYNTAYEATLEPDGTARRTIEFDFVYSSACPCSAELAEHARETRGVYAIAHNQRSKARLRVEIAPGKKLSPEDLHAHCLRALKTETQVMVKREDEQAFAELNGAYIKFVEDAARLLHAELDADPRIRDFTVSCAHLESLHSHDAVSSICKGIRGGLTADSMDFRQLIC